MSGILRPYHVDKANDGIGGAGYEKQIIIVELLADLNTNLVIPLIRNNTNASKVPTFLRGRVYINFEEDKLYESNYEELLRDLLDEPVLPIPPLGDNPFKTVKYFAEQKFIVDSEKYVSPATRGTVTFDYSNNNGRYFIGQNEHLFELDFSKSSNTNIQFLNDPASIKSVSIVKDKSEISDIADARNYDASSRIRRPNVNQIAVVQNVNGFYAAIKIVSIKDDTRGTNFDEVVFDYIIQSNGSPDFTSFK